MSNVFLGGEHGPIELLTNGTKLGVRNYALNSVCPFVILGNKQQNQMTSAYNLAKPLANFSKEELSHIILSWRWSVSSGATGTANIQFNNLPWEGNYRGDLTMDFSKANSGTENKKLDFSSYSSSDLVATGLGVRCDNFSGTLTIDHMKLSIGDIATDWTPAPEDYDKLFAGSYAPKSSWNLLDGTADFSKISNNTGDGGIASDTKTPAGNISYHKNDAWNYPNFAYTVQKGKIYTFSFSVKFMTQMAGAMILYSDPTYNILRQTDIDMPNEPLDTWIRTYYTFQSNIDGQMKLGISSSVNGDAYVGDYMLNEGTYPLDWNYSFNDIKPHLSGR